MPLVHEFLQRHDRPHLRLTGGDGACAEISLHGAHVTSWQPVPGRERLYLSPNAAWREGAAIRGGIPVIFPQFGGLGPLSKHGFARLLDWTFAGIEPFASIGDAAVFELNDSDATRAQWLHRFRARIAVGMAPGSLQVALEILNRGDTAFEFTAALHTYLRVARLSEVALSGLEATPYTDTARGGALMPADGAPVHFKGELDRVYASTPSRLVLHDGERALDIEAEGFRDTVVWNPGATLAAAMGDLGAGEHLRFVCVEAAAVAAPVTLAPGESWRGVQRLRD